MCENVHIMNTNMPAGVGAHPLDTQLPSTLVHLSGSLEILLGLPNAWWQHQHYTGDSKQPVQAGPFGNTVHAPYKYFRIVNHSPSPLLFSPIPTSSPAHAFTPDSPQDQAPPPLNPTTSLTSPWSTSSQMKNPYPDSPPNYSAPPPQVTQPRTNGHPPLPSLQRSPHSRRRYELLNYASLTSIIGNYDVCSSVGAPPPQHPKSIWYSAAGV